MTEDRLLDGQRKQPFILAIGKKCSPEQIFLIFENNSIEVVSLLKGVDLCFKLTFLLNLEFSPYCSNVWHFLNSCFFKCDVKNDIPACVKDLKNAIYVNFK